MLQFLSRDHFSLGTREELCDLVQFLPSLGCLQWPPVLLLKGFLLVGMIQPVFTKYHDGGLRIPRNCNDIVPAEELVGHVRIDYRLRNIALRLPVVPIHVWSKVGYVLVEKTKPAGAMIADIPLAVGCFQLKTLPHLIRGQYLKLDIHACFFLISRNEDLLHWFHMSARMCAPSERYLLARLSIFLLASRKQHYRRQ